MYFLKLQIFLQLAWISQYFGFARFEFGGFLTEYIFLMLVAASAHVAMPLISEVWFKKGKVNQLIVLLD